MFTRIYNGSVNITKYSLSLFFVAMFMISTISKANAEEISISKKATTSSIKIILNQATLIKLDDYISDAIVGNPAIADITIQNAQSFVLTGKSYGRTNLILLNKTGSIIFNKSVFVDDDQQNIVSVQRGNSRISLTCAPKCQPTPTIGDTTEYVQANSANLKSKLKDVNNAMQLSQESN